MLVPREPIADRRPEAARADHVVVWHVDMPPIRRTTIRLRQPRDHTRVVAAPRRVGEPKRRENAFRREGFEVHAAHAFHEGAREQKARIGIGVVIADRIVQRLLVGDDLEHIRLGVHARTARPSLPGDEVAPLTQSGGVREQMAHGDDAPVAPEFRQVRARIVVEAKLAVGHEQHHGGRRELLRHRTRFEHGGGQDGQAARQVRHAIAALEQRGAAAGDTHAAAGAVGAIPRGEHPVSDRDQLSRGGLLGLDVPRAHEGRERQGGKQQHRSSDGACGYGACGGRGGERHAAKLQRGAAGHHFAGGASWQPAGGGDVLAPELTRGVSCRHAHLRLRNDSLGVGRRARAVRTPSVDGRSPADDASGERGARASGVVRWSGHVHQQSVG